MYLTHGHLRYVAEDFICRQNLRVHSHSLILACSRPMKPQLRLKNTKVDLINFGRQLLSYLPISCRKIRIKLYSFMCSRTQRFFFQIILVIEINQTVNLS